MNAIEKMQQEGTLSRYVKDSLKPGVLCPRKYGLDDKCNAQHAECWEYALTKEYEEVKG